jgi:hypothetical protein
MLAMHEVLGMTGLLMESVAAFCLRTGRCKMTSWYYLLSMTIGTILALYTLAHDWNLSLFLANIFWLIFNVWCIIKWKMLTYI